MSNNSYQEYSNRSAAGNSFDEFTATRNNTANATSGASATPSASDPNRMLTGVLMGAVVLFTLILIIPCVLQRLRRKVPVSDLTRLQVRYETIEGWLISKVRAFVSLLKAFEGSIIR